MADPDRRRLLEWIVWLGAGLFGAIASVPLVGSVLDPVTRGRRGSRRGFVRVARLEALGVGEPRRVQVVSEAIDGWIRAPRRPLGAVWLLRKGGERVRAWSAVCPHLGCGIEPAADGGFTCPCHRSRFDGAGRRIDGPSPRGMDPLDVRVVRGEVLVRWARFRRGTSRRSEV
ncbi:MAG: Rieske (2Fe-2S) protein [Deltaproteobacteria bacterium]|nr:Rieske (2Fe-2S) protein [Deltaproteobacteria bacterium]